MRRTKSGARNKQDWDIKDHLAAGHSPVAPPLTLAMTNIGTSAANLESAARALKRIDEQDRVLGVQRMLLSRIRGYACPCERGRR